MMCTKRFHNLHLRSLDGILAIPSCAVRVGIEISRMTGFNQGAKGELRLFRPEGTPF